jgi:hypothetical protein
MADQDSRPVNWRRLLLLPLQIVVALLVIIDELARPLYGPLVRWFASLRVVAIGEATVARLPRFVILILLVVPLAIAEPLKVYGLIVMGEGKLIRGVLILAFAYLASFLLIERIYEAGKPKLMTIGWFAQLMGLIAWIRSTIIDWVKRTPVWALVTATREMARRLVSTFRTERRG